MKFTRLIIGFLIVVVALFVIAGEHLAGVSSNAVINARTTTVRAPIAGELTVLPRLLGSRIVEGEELGSLEGEAAASEMLHDLIRERADKLAEIARLQRIAAAVSDSLEASPGGSDEAADEAGRRLRQEELAAMLEAEKAKLAALEKRLSVERFRSAGSGGARLVSNVNGLLWEVLAADGETVQQGQELLRLVDCDSSGVTLSVTESVYNRLQQGDAAQFRVNNDRRVFEGTVTRLAGSGAETIYRNLAIAPSQRHLERFDVTLYVPGLRQDEELTCAIGRTGRVFFEARPLDFLRRLWE